jgi:Ca2+-binding RTX toxin-like protein
MSDRLINAILSMDAYNRGYGAAISGLDPVGKIGNVSILTFPDSVRTGWEGAGFYAIAYKFNNVIVDGVTISGQKRIAYRGTDEPLRDAANGYGLGLGYPDSPQTLLAVDFYKAVAGKTAGVQNNPFIANIVTTGHSLGGGLAGYVAAIYGKSSEIYDTMSFQLGTANAFLLSDTGADLALRSRLYGNYAPPPINVSKITASETIGQIIEGVQGVGAGIPTITYDSYSEAGPLGTPGAVEKHSMALLVSLIYADERVTRTDWKFAGSNLWKAYFDDSIATALPETAPQASGGRTGQTATASDTLRTAIAYSAIKEGTRPFGDTAIDAMFDDANDLGEVLKTQNASAVVRDGANAIAKVFVEYAGGLALNANLRALNPTAVNGVLKLSSDRSTLAVDMGGDLWNEIGPYNGIIGKDELINTVVNQPGEFGDPLISELRRAMLVAYNDPGLSTVDRVLLPTTDGAVITTIERRSGAGKQTLFVSGSDADTITGSRDNDVIYGGAGNDNINGAGGNDALLGGAGDDRLNGGVGDDTAFGGFGDDTILGGDDNDYLDGGLDNDIIRGGAGDDYVIGDSGEDRLFSGGGANNWLYGGDDDDLLTFDGGGGVAIGGLGNDRILMSMATGVGIVAGAGNDIIDLRGGFQNAYITYYKGDGFDTVLGLTSDNVVFDFHDSATADISVFYKVSTSTPRYINDDGTIRLESTDYTGTMLLGWQSGNGFAGIKVGEVSLNVLDASYYNLNLFPGLQKVNLLSQQINAVALDGSISFGEGGSSDVQLRFVGNIRPPTLAPTLMAASTSADFMTPDALDAFKAVQQMVEALSTFGVSSAADLTAPRLHAFEREPLFTVNRHLQQSASAAFAMA